MKTRRFPHTVSQAGCHRRGQLVKLSPMMIITEIRWAQLTACALAALVYAGPAPAPAQTDAGPDPTTEQEAIDAPPPSAAPGASPEAVKKTITVMGFEVMARTGTYRVTADANVRKGPGTNHERVAGVFEGDRIQSIGQADGSPWVAISKDGETLGYIHNGVLKAVVDGTIGEEVRDRIVTGSVACDYRLRFEGRTAVEGANFDTADYEMLFRCANAKQSTIFYGHMFLTEAPVDSSGKRHLISLDFRSIGDGLEEYLTSTFYYDFTKGEMTFVGHSLPKYALPPDETQFKTSTTQSALIAALETAVSTWTPEAWSALFNKED